MLIHKFQATLWLKGTSIGAEPSPSGLLNILDPTAKMNTITNTAMTNNKA